MKDLVCEMTNEELADMGRAMERSGHNDIDSFLKWAALSKTKEILQSDK